MKVRGSTFLLFEVVQRGLQQRQFQHLEGADFYFENAHLQRLFQVQEGFSDIQFHCESVLERLDQ
ncbi:hypothetical protein D3C84_699640 [compost metagenome]